ncbi:DNA polymerase III subunit chi [Aquidulcibacter paucihalophilus]|uniref:DNA polymerase III subunit chi n=1 Tax=Aquidulcibacter paucihalophilus TaxID=1978549 RepID=UPI000A18F80F|nr:DNA polymerase III subunit chi [Aquidulcibacter paucihalophilus]
MTQAAAEIWFYHLESASVEETLPPLIEKCLDRGWRAQVLSPSAERLQALDTHLWTWKPNSWLPHHSPGAEMAHLAPVQLGEAPQATPPAEAVFLLDGANWGPLEGVSRVFVLFDGRDPDTVSQARQQWRVAKEAGLLPTYWRQGEDGRWAKNG